MKKLLFFAALFLVPSAVKAGTQESYNLFQSSYVTQSVSLRLIPAVLPNSVFYGVVVGTTASGGRVQIFDSSGTSTNQFADIATGVQGFYPYSVLLSSGITYTTTGIGNGGITLIYRKTR